MAPPRLHLGPFALTVPVAQGAMGEVWRGLHLGQQVPVAVKVVRPRARELDSFTRIFRSEIRRMARLDHPGIVLVLDHGEVTEEAAQASGGRLVAGEPWLAMEYASGGTLEQSPPPPDWGALRDVLADLLAALAHAHAHGLLHRDIKPANVLRGTDLDLRPGLKLADFGIAFALEEDGDLATPGFAGTPIYMAPEQVRGSLREQGPWTDLYSLGGMAWRLATGRNVFDDRDQGALLRAQLEREPGRFEPGFPVPPDLEAWLRVLLEKDPRARWRCAADARAALLALGPVSAGRGRAVSMVATAGGSEETWGFDQDRVVFADTPPDLGPAPVAPALPRVEPPFPATWQAHRPALPVRLVGAGLGLYGLRALPLVDREGPRDRLWASLRAVCEGEGPRAVVLQGPAGLGKSRLATWLATRADELGLAVPFRTGHGPTPGRRGGVGGLLRRLLRVDGVGADRLRLQVHERLAALGLHDPADARGVLAWMGGWVDAPAPPLPARAALLRRVLDGARRGRPAILVVDDAWWGLETLRLARALVQEGAAAPPLLVLVTCRDTSPSGVAEAEAELARLCALPQTAQVGVGPLAAADVDTLVRELLVLDQGLVASVGARAGGSPLFAVQLVGDWVRRGVLDVGEDGFVLREGEAARIPDDIHVVWQDRVALALGDQAPVARRALQLAAVLAAIAGTVDAEEWRRACALLGVPVPDDLVDALARARLVQPEESGWSFAHSMLRESVERVADEAGETAALHAACAAMLAAGPAEAGQAERLGLHRLGAGDTAGALAPLLDGAEAAHLQDRFARAWELLDRAEAAGEGGGVPADDARLGRLGTLRLRVLLSQGRLDEADHQAARLAQQARRRRWPGVQSAALRARGAVALKRGDLLAAEAALHQGLTQAERAGLGVEAAMTRLQLGTLARMRGERDRALALLQEARTGLEGAGDPLVLASCLVDLAGACSTFGDPVQAAAVARDAARAFVALGNQTGEGRSLNALGDALRKQGDLPGAAAAYTASRALLARTGSHIRSYPLLNLALVHLEQGQPAPALAALDTARQEATERGDRVVEAYAWGLGTACQVGLGRWAAATEHLDQADALLAETGVVEPDLANMLERAARAAAAAGQAEVAQAAALIAAEQLRALGEEARAAALDPLLD